MGDITHDEVGRFRDWLVSRGAEILAPKPFEVLRFTKFESIGLLQHNKAGEISYANPIAWDAIRCWREGRNWRAVPREVRHSKRWASIQALIQRDGSACLWCRAELQADDMTIEHIVPLTSGGPDKLANMAIACAPCNRAMGHLSAVEKIRAAMRGCDAPVAGEGVD